MCLFVFRSCLFSPCSNTRNTVKCDVGRRLFTTLLWPLSTNKQTIMVLYGFIFPTFLNEAISIHASYLFQLLHSQWKQAEGRTHGLIASSCYLQATGLLYYPQKTHWHLWDWFTRICTLHQVVSPLLMSACFFIFAHFYFCFYLFVLIIIFCILKCIPYVYHMYTACIPYVYRMYTACIPHVYCMHTTCIPHVDRKYIASIPHVYRMYTACILHVCRMYTTCPNTKDSYFSNKRILILITRHTCEAVLSPHPPVTCMCVNKLDDPPLCRCLGLLLWD